MVVPRFIQSERMSQGSTNVGAHCQWPADQEGVLNSTERFECQSVCSTGHSERPDFFAPQTHHSPKNCMSSSLSHIGMILNFYDAARDTVTTDRRHR